MLCFSMGNLGYLYVKINILDIGENRGQVDDMLKRGNYESSNRDNSANNH